MGGEEERQRKKECVKDSRMDRATPGEGAGCLGLWGLSAASLRGRVWGAGQSPRSHPTGWRALCPG